MPRYDYRCEAGHKYESQEPFGSPSEQPCQRCGKPAHRQIVAPTVLFKGGGFYKTSSRSDLRPDADTSSSARSKTPPSSPSPSDFSPSTSHDTPAASDP